MTGDTLLFSPFITGQKNDASAILSDDQKKVKEILRQFEEHKPEVFDIHQPIIMEKYSSALSEESQSGENTLEKILRENKDLLDQLNRQTSVSFEDSDLLDQLIEPEINEETTEALSETPETLLKTYEETLPNIIPLHQVGENGENKEESAEIG